MNSYLMIMFIATFFSASSQVLLKKSANIEHKSFIYEYLNWRVILAYFIVFAGLLVNTYAYTGADMKYGAVIDGFTYVFVMFLSWIVLKEKFNKWKVVGNILIATGITVYML